MSDTAKHKATPERISRVGALRAATAGGEAQRAGADVTDCPHPATGTVVERFYAFYWRKGFRAAAADD